MSFHEIREVAEAKQVISESTAALQVAAIGGQPARIEQNVVSAGLPLISLEFGDNDNYVRHATGRDGDPPAWPGYTCASDPQCRQPFPLGAKW